MLRDLLRLGRACGSSGGGTDSMTDDAGGAVALGLQAAVPCVSTDQVSCLITSCTRKQEKRKADSSQGQTGAAQQLGKRSKGADQLQGPQVCMSDTSIDDQENQQQQLQQQHQVLHAQPQASAQQPQIVRAACSTLGHMLAPLLPHGWAPQHAASGEALQQQQQQLHPLPAAEAGEVGEGGSAAAWSDENVACSEDPLTAPSTSSAPTVSNPSSTAGTGSASLTVQVQHAQPPYALPAEPEQDQLATQQQQPSHSCGGVAVTSGGNTADDSTDEADYEEDNFDPYTFIGGLGPVEHYVPPGRQPLLPRQTRACKQKTLVLDLDETLVHSTLDAAGGAGADFSFPVTFNGAEHMVHVRTRPHMQAFLERCAELFEVVVFTASQKVYAEKLLNILDPARALIRHRIYRDSCVFVNGNYLKDLSVLGRDLSRTAIVDNSPQAFGFQVSNGIPIESWYDDPEDTELLQLLPFLEDIAAGGVGDVRPAITRRFNLGAMVAAKVAEALAAAETEAHQQQQQQWQWQQQQHVAAHQQQHVAAQQQQQQQQQHAVAMMAQVASAAAGVLQTQSLPGMAAQMVLQHPQQAQEQAA